jgi:hypothetical protein
VENIHENGSLNSLRTLERNKIMLSTDKLEIMEKK